MLYVEGKDAADFLHRVTAGRVKGLKPGEGAAGLLLNGQSRMLAQFDLIRLTETKVLLAAPEPCVLALRINLESLHFAEDLQFDLPDGFLTEEFTHEPARGQVFLTHQDGSWPSFVPGYRRRISEELAPLPESFHFDRIGAGLPWPHEDWSENTPALEAGTLPWIDRDKGCYPGQEVVERSINVGHPARVMQAAEGPEPPGEKVKYAAGAEGPVLSRATKGALTRIMVRAPWPQRQNPPEGFNLLSSWE